MPGRRLGNSQSLRCFLSLSLPLRSNSIMNSNTGCRTESPIQALRQRGARRGPWLTSLVMYSNCMRFVDELGIRARELEKLARTPTNLDGMERWGYVTVAPDPNDPQAQTAALTLAD